jgi:hypothetical protein
MKKEKQFDCVQMKWEIQQQVEKKLAGLSGKEAHKVKIEKGLKNNILGVFMEKLCSAHHIPAPLEQALIDVMRTLPLRRVLQVLKRIA